MGKNNKSRFRGRQGGSSNHQPAGAAKSGSTDEPHKRAPTPGAEGIIFRSDGSSQANVKRDLDAIADLLPNMSVYKAGGPDIAAALKSRKAPDFKAELGPKPEDTADELDKEMHEEKKKRIVTRAHDYDDNVKRLFHLLISHCTEKFQTQLKKNPAWADVAKKADGVGLARLIETVMYAHGKTEVTYDNASDALTKLLTVQQGTMSNQMYITTVRGLATAAAAAGNEVGTITAKIDALMEDFLKHNTLNEGEEKETKRKELTKVVQDRYIAIIALKGADRVRYGECLEAREIRIAGGKDEEVPEDLNDLCLLLDDWEKVYLRSQAAKRATKPGPGTPAPTPAPKDNEGTTETKEDEKEAKEGVAYMQDGNSVTCYLCSEKGHKSFECPKKVKKEGVSGMQQIDDAVSVGSSGDEWVDEGCNHHQRNDVGSGDADELDAEKLYIDSCTRDTTIAEKILSDVREEKVPLMLKCNAGKMLLRHKGLLGNHRVWARLCGQGIANLISLHEFKLYLDEIDGDISYNKGVWRIEAHGKEFVALSDEDGPCANMPYITRKMACEIFRDASASDIPAVDISDSYESVPIQSMPQTGNPKSSVSTGALKTTWPALKAKGRTKVRFNADVGGVAFAQDVVPSVRGNMEGYSKQQVEAARSAREMQLMVGSPPDRAFREMVRKKQLSNCNITSADVTNASAIFGPSRAVLRGSSTQERPQPVDTTVIDIPRDFYLLHKFVTLSGDVMYCNGLAFFTTISKNIGFITGEFLPNCKSARLKTSLISVLQFYGKHGYVVNRVFMDNQFEPLKEMLPLVNIETVAAGEHAVQIERAHRTIKNRARGLLAELRYSYFPTQMIIHLIYHVIMWLNATNFNMDPNLSVRELITGQPMDVSLHCQAVFGAYVEPVEPLDVTNGMDWRTEPSIALGSAGNLNGTQKVLCLRTNKVRRRRNIRNKVLPCPGSVITMVNALGIRNKQEKYGRSLVFLDRNQNPYNWEDEDADELEDITEYTSHPEMADELPGVTWESDLQPANESAEDTEVGVFDSVTDDAQESAAHDAPTGVDEYEEAPNDEYDEFGEQYENEFEVEEVDEDDGDEDDVSEDDVSEDEDDEDFIPEESAGVQSAGVPEIAGVPEARYPTRIRSAPQTYEPTMSGKVYPTNGELKTSQIHFQQSTVETPLKTNDEFEEQVIGTIMMQQYYYSKGLKIFGEPGSVAMKKELQQMHDMEAYAPLDASTLTEKEKEDAVNQLMFITQKRCGKIKARSCADGRKQREYIRKEDASSPTVCLESIFITMCIEAHEGRKVATMDIPGAFLHTDIDEDVVMQLRGKLAEMMVQVDPKLYRDHVVMENGQKVLYVKAQKCVYGLLRSSLLFYRKLKADLVGLGFEFNPYDPCTANKMINGKQMTVVFHVDDLKVSHVEQKQIDWLAGELRKIYGNKLAVNNGKIHDYLGMMIDYSIDGKVQVSMIKFIKKIFDAFPEELKSTAATPAAEYLFKTREEGETKCLDQERADAFGSVTAMLLFLSSRARRDIQTAVSFLTTRLKKPDEDDWGKLKRVLKYLKGTLHMKLTLEVDSLGILRWWIDSSHGVHMDLRGQTGTMLSMGKGATLSSSTKQKMNTKSSTESEMVGAYDGLGLVLWVRHFVEAQGYSIDHNIINQDNQSTILLLRNGRSSSTKRTKHIHARYFFVKDKIDSGEVEVEYCPTEEMWADVNTKPQQGRLFRVMRSHLMNVPIDYDDVIEAKRTCTELGGPCSRYSNINYTQECVNDELSE